MNTNDTESDGRSDAAVSVLLSALMVLSVVALGTTAFAGSAAAQTQADIVVDADGSGDYTTIQAAVDNASDGDTIEVAAGTYTESVTISTANVTLLGPNAGTPGDGDRGAEAIVEGSVSITASNVTVDGFTVRSDSSGLISLGGAEYTLTNNVLNASSGVRAAYGKADAGLLANNTIVAGGTSNYGVRIGDATDVTVVDNTFVQEAVPESSSNTPQGLLLSSTVDTEVRHNTFVGIDSGQAVLVSNNAGNSSGVTVADNRVDGFANGVFLYENADEIKDVSVTGNDVTNVSDVGITAVDTSGSDGFTGLNGADTAANQADALLSSNEVGVVTVGGQTVTADPVTVDGDGPSNYATIQDAIDTVPNGTTVVVAAGTYAENVTVSTANVTLMGPNAGVPGDGDRSEEATINGQLIVSADGVTVDGFDVSPPNATENQNAEALRVSGNADDVIVRNNVVRDFGEDSLSEWLGTDAINVFGGSSSDAVENVTITDNLVDGISGRDAKGGTTGVSIQGNVVNATVADNTITNVGQAETAWAFGVVVRGTDNHGETPTNVSVVGNDISDVVSNQSTATSGVGIGLESGTASDVTFAGNEISNAELLLEDKTATVDLHKFIANNTIDRGVPLAGVEFNEKAPRNVIFGNVQDAVDAASSGDTIELRPGTYDEPFEVSTDNLTILGAGSNEVTIDVTNAGDVRGINAKADNLTLSGFTLVGPGGDGKQGIHTGSPPHENLHVRDVVVKDFDRNGIDVHGVDGVVLTNVEAHNNSGVGIALTDSANITVSQASATNNSWGGLALWSNGGFVNDGVGIHHAVVVNSTFANNSGSGVYMEDSAGVGPDGFEDIVVRNSEIESNGVGFAALPGTNASAVTLYQNDIVDNNDSAIAVNEDAHGSLDATFNWWGTERGPAADAVKGDVRTNPYLTVQPSEAADTPENITEFADTVEMDAGAHAFGVPGPVEGTVGSMFNDFNGTVYAYADGSWTQVTDADRELSALDALLVVPDDGETARATVEIAEGSGTAAPSSKDLDAGWNFVGAPQSGAIEAAYGAASADPARALNLYDTPTVGGTSPAGDWTKYTFGTASDGPDVSSVSAYWVYAEEDGSVAANVPAGVTYEEYTQLTDEYASAS